MPEWLEALTVGEIVAWGAGITAVVVGAVPVVRTIVRAVREISTFLEDWNGAPERKDRAGRVIEAARPGVPALLETVRSQVQNSHSTNLRDDVDVVRQSVEMVSAKLDEHVTISKHHDREQADVKARLDAHIESTDRWTAMLEDLHYEWSSRPKRRPPESK